MKENKGLIINVGTSSVVLILLVFALSVFALLSIRASNSELQLAKRTGESVQEYYTADGVAEYALCYIQQVIENSKVEELEEKLKNIDVSGQEKLEKIQNMKLNLEDIVIFTGKPEDKLGTIEYAIPIREGIQLEVKLALYGDRRLSVEVWRMVKAAGDIEEFEQNVELWDGLITAE